ncbi:unnamed protein product [Mucor hiemalis]
MENRSKDCRDIVLEYLFHYCHENTAKALLSEISNLDSCTEELHSKALQNNCYVDVEANSNSSYEWSSLGARKDINDAIKRGDIGKAFTLIELHFPALIRTFNTINRLGSNEKPKPLPKLHYTLYNLRCQQFIEALRFSGEMEAIQFAQYYLRPCHDIYPDLTNSVTTLIAYEDLESENTKDLLSQQRRDDIAEEVNEMILESQQFSPKTTLEKLWRQKTVVQVELDNQMREQLSKNSKEMDNLEKVPM